MPFQLVQAEEHADLVAQYGVQQAPTLIVSQAGSMQKFVSVSEIRRYLEHNESCV